MLLDILREYHIMIRVNLDEAQPFENLVHHKLNGRRRVHQTTRHEFEFKIPKTPDELLLLHTIL